jgi:ABC-type Na+ efflux pump permease subunit
MILRLHTVIFLVALLSMMLAAIFGEVVKNIELPTFSRRQETLSKLLYLLTGGFIAGFITSLFLLTRPVVPTTGVNLTFVNHNELK